MSKELATIKLDCELDISLDEMTIESLFNDDSYKIFKRLGFNSLLKKVWRSDRDGGDRSGYHLA